MWHKDEDEGVGGRSNGTMHTIVYIVPLLLCTQGERECNHDTSYTNVNADTFSAFIITFVGERVVSERERERVCPSDSPSPSCHSGRAPGTDLDLREVGAKEDEGKGDGVSSHHHHHSILIARWAKTRETEMEMETARACHPHRLHCIEVARGR